MNNIQDKVNTISKVRNHKRILIGIFVMLAVFILFFVTYAVIIQPERSVASFCKVAKENKSSLLSNANNEQSLDVYKKLEVVAPNDIRPDITTIKKGYEAIVQDPAQTINVGLGMSASESRRTDYINKNCPDF